MNHRNSHPSTEFVTTAATRHFPKEPTMNRLFIALLSTLIVALFALNPTTAFAQDNTPDAGDAADQAYLQEYHRRAVEKYESMLATQAAKNAAINNRAMPDWGGEIFVQEYEQRTREKYAAVQKSATPVVVDSMPDWGGAIFLAEYEQRAQERYQVWLAQRDNRLTGNTSR